jgi:hypothetical protein
MSRTTPFRFCFLVLSLVLTALAGSPVRQAEAATCCELEYQSCAADCGSSGVATFECTPIGRGCKFYCECNL